MQRLTLITLLCLMILGIYLRVGETSGFYFSPDEAVNRQVVRADSLSTVLRYSLYETNPPLGNLLRHYWLQWGDSPQWARSLSLAFGIALIPLCYAIGLRLGGAATGLIAAAFVTFGNEAITQSFILRNYTIFACFLALAVYHYLGWHRTRRPASLCAYITLSALANGVHFSGLFFSFSIGCCELVMLGASRQWRFLRWWCAAHLVLGVLLVAQLAFWHGLAGNSHLGFLSSLGDHLADATWYPAIVFDRLLPGGNSPYYSLALLCLMPLVLFILWRFRASADPLAAIALFGLAFSTAMVGIGAYPGMNGRHAFWLLPLLVPAVAAVVARAGAVVPEGKRLAVGIAALAAMAVLADKDRSEYYLTPSLWRQYDDYARTLDKHRIVMSSKGEVMLLQLQGRNPYEAMQKADATNPTGSLASMDYYNTRLYFNRREWFYDTGALLATTLAEAEDKAWIAPGDILVFIVATEPVYRLMECRELKKEIRIFSQKPTAPLPLPLNGAYSDYIAVMEVPWRELHLHINACLQDPAGTSVILRK